MINISNAKQKYVIGLLLAFSIGFAANYAYHFYTPEDAHECNVGVEERIVVEDIAAPVEDSEIILTVGKGNTIGKLLLNNGITSNQSHSLIKELNKVYSVKSLKVGQEIIIKVDKTDSQPKLKELRFRPTFSHEYVATLDENNRFTVEAKEIELLHEVKWGVGTINGSIYKSAVSNGVPDRIVRSMINAFSHDVDFQRGLKTGDKFALLYEVTSDPLTGEQRPGNLLYAGLLVGGKLMHVYRYKPKNGVYEYYNHKGEGTKKGLLKTPVDGARLSDGFGMRHKHPVLGYSKFHKGVDFAAPQGTPIMAAGNGVVTKIGKWGAYGNYIQIRHNGEYSTAYAHLKKYASGLRAGSKVTQGTVIGYVGATGRTTGAHLHYEVLRHNKHINPLSVKMVSSSKLSKKDLQEFNKAKGSIEQHYAALGRGQKFDLAQVSTFLSATVDFKNIAVSELNVSKKKLA